MRDYRPLIPATDQVTREFTRIREAAQRSQAFALLQELTEAPERLVDGMVARADGTNWNPGGGRGLYVYENGAWTKCSTGKAIAFSAYRTTNQTISHATITTIICGSEHYDTDSAYNTSTGEFTAPIAGVYHFDGMVCLDTSVTTGVSGLSVNGSIYLLGLLSAGLTAGTYLPIAGDLLLAAGDTVSMFVSNDSGGSSRNAIGTSVAPFSTRFQGHIVRHGA